MNKEIIPACMPHNLDDLRERASFSLGHVTTMQIDIMDGKYVPDKTWPFFHNNDYDFEDIKNGEKGLPFWESINYELDLMVEKPEEYFSDWLSLGPSRIILHLASVSDWKKIKDFSSELADFIELGLAVTIHDDKSNIKEKLGEHSFQFIQVMGIDHIGYSGEPFDDRSLEFISWLKKEYPMLPISIDGGVSEQTIPFLRDLGVDRFVSGSGIFNHGIPEENILFLQDLANNINYEEKDN